MKIWIVRVLMVAMVGSLLSGCFASKPAKRGCPSNSSSMGAERVLAGEKPEKKSKYKVKGMN